MLLLSEREQHRTSGSSNRGREPTHRARGMQSVLTIIGEELLGALQGSVDRFPGDEPRNREGGLAYVLKGFPLDDGLHSTQGGCHREFERGVPTAEARVIAGGGWSGYWEKHHTLEGFAAGSDSCVEPCSVILAPRAGRGA